MVKFEIDAWPENLAGTDWEDINHITSKQGRTRGFSMHELPEPEKQLTVEVLLKMYETRYVLAKQAEDQRATMSNFLITIAAATFAFISQQEFSKQTIPVGLLTIFLGLFGLFMSAKYSQHYLKNYRVAKLISKRIAQLCPQAQLREIECEALDESASRDPFFSKFPTLYLWSALHIMVCLIGGLCVLLALLQ
ncbi:hypothetical protein [Nodosilinea sp. FACHB-13]|uniref:hypothetical protein n=1 Tax=Cyanophyceae TaxID=3028117 RepID=UPI001687B000|nr:hypothetical protein [Nodosilinea sp. FACHB-13]MBD2106020.1 hypothetical protein [Nodosilinea sp. FACHB-13]